MSKILAFVFLVLVTSCYSKNGILLFVFLLLGIIYLLAIMIIFFKNFLFICLFFLFLLNVCILHFVFVATFYDFFAMKVSKKVVFGIFLCPQLIPGAKKSTNNFFLNIQSQRFIIDRCISQKSFLSKFNGNGMVTIHIRLIQHIDGTQQKAYWKCLFLVTYLIKFKDAKLHSNRGAAAKFGF